MKRKLTLIAILTLIICVLIAPNALAETYGDFEYTDNGDTTCTITGYTGSGGNVVIPSSINGLTVTIIGDSAFRSKSLSGVTLPTNLVTIDTWAFGSNDISTVVFPDSLTSIGTYAFYRNKIANITISDNVATIGNKAFYSNGTTTLTLGSDVTSIGDEAFASSAITSITFGDSLTTIGNRAFNVNKLTSLTIPDTVTHIDEGAFKNGCLTSVTIGSGVVSIGQQAFNKNSITQVNGEASNGIIYQRKSDASVDYTCIACYGGTATELGAGFIPFGVETIENYAFNGSSITSVVLPESLRTIKEYAFYYNELTSVTFPQSVISIERCAFYSNNLPSDKITLRANTGVWRDNNYQYVNGGDSVAETGGYTRINQIPQLKDGVNATDTADTVMGVDYTLDLSTIFEDGNSDPMTYQVQVDGAEYVAADEAYSYSPSAAGDTVLLFKANDGISDSTETHQVTLTTVVNVVPDRKDGVLETATAETAINIPYNLDLSTIFKDDNGHDLTYEVMIDGGDYQDTDPSYSYTSASSKVVVFTFRAHDGYDYSTETHEVTLTVTSTPPNRIEGVPETATALVELGSAYNVDLSTIFEDLNGDPLKYFVKIDEADYAEVAVLYSFTPQTSGEFVLVFKANDGADDSTDTYTVTVTANTRPTRKDGVDAQVNETVEVNSTFTVNLANIFVDADDNTLSYQVRIDGGEYTDTFASYSITPDEPAEIVLEFMANDTYMDSTDTYQVILTAEYMEHTVTFMPNGGDGFSSFSEEHTANTDIILEDEEFVGNRNGYIPTGWNTQADGQGTHYDFGAAYTVPTSNSTLYVEWIASEYTITYNLSGGTNNAGNPAMYIVDDTPVTLLDATKADFVFMGWYDNVNYSGSVIEEIEENATGDKEYWARWKKSCVVSGRLKEEYYRADETKASTYVYYGESTDTGIKSRYKYDEAEVLLEMTSYNTEGKRTTMTKYHANGKAKYKYFYNTATNVKKSMMSYNESGVQIAKTEYYANGQSAKKQYIYYATGKKKIIKNYRTNKKLSSQTWFYTDGTSRKQFNTYDANGNLTSVSKYYKNGTRYYYKKY